MKRKVCVITGSRADYGLLKAVMHKIKGASDLQLQIIVTGMHLSSTYGMTYLEIINDGFNIDRKIECLIDQDDPISVAASMGKTIAESAKAFKDLKPDVILVLGDRFEIFSAVAAALTSKIPVAHIHGGETTFGAYDEAFRHSITKMSQIHFVATEDYRRRVIQLGENPDRVYLVGGVGIDDINNLNVIGKPDLEKDLSIKFRERNLLVTFHPTTLERESVDKQINALLSALENRPDTCIIFTMPNADTGGQTIMRFIEDFVSRNSNSYVFRSLGRHIYLSCMASVDAVIGNSSSGILEAPSLKVGTINIGIRQQGRIQASSVINCGASKDEICDALEELYSESFRLKLKSCRNPYGEGGASVKIVNVLREVNLESIVQKHFYDL